MKKLILILCIAMSGQVYGQIDFEKDFINERKALNSNSMDLNEIHESFYDNRTMYERIGVTRAILDEVHNELKLIDTHYAYYYGIKSSCENDYNWTCASVKSSVLYSVEGKSRQLKRYLRLPIKRVEDLLPLLRSGNKIIVRNTLNELIKVQKKIDGIVKEFDDIKK